MRKKRLLCLQAQAIFLSKLGLASALVMLLSVSGFAAVLPKIIQNFTQRTGFSVSFAEKNYDNYNQEVLQASGELYYLKGGLLRFEYFSPDEQTIVVGKEKIWIYDPVLNNVIIDKIDQVAGLEALNFLRQAESLKQLFAEQTNQTWGWLQPTNNQSLVSLLSKKSDSLVEKIEIAYDKKSFAIEQIALLDKQENLRIFVFSDYVERNDLTLQTFTFIPPKNVETIENY